MIDVVAFPLNPPPAARGVGWVLSAAAALVALAVWFVVLLQLALVVKAEWQLRQIVAEANAFAELPLVRPAELRAFVSVRTGQAGWPAARMLILPQFAQPHRFHVVQVEVPAVSALPRLLQPLAIGLRDGTLRAGSIPAEKAWGLIGGDST